LLKEVDAGRFMASGTASLTHAANAVGPDSASILGQYVDRLRRNPRLTDFHNIFTVLGQRVADPEGVLRAGQITSRLQEFLFSLQATAKNVVDFERDPLGKVVPDDFAFAIACVFRQRPGVLVNRDENIRAPADSASELHQQIIEMQERGHRETLERERARDRRAEEFAEELRRRAEPGWRQPQERDSTPRRRRPESFLRPAEPH
jgi:hypothetical protein